MRENIAKWFKENITDDGKPYLLDKHQAAIVRDHHKNTLVTARAGSGKTRTIVAKIAYLLTHEHIPAENIIVFAFNRKARAEINERLTKICYNGEPLFKTPPSIATTFHAFAYQCLGGKKLVADKLLTEDVQDQILSNLIKQTGITNISEKQATLKQFIARAEQKFFINYQILDQKIETITKSNQKSSLTNLNNLFKKYQARLESSNKLSFNQIIKLASDKIKNTKTDYEYIFVDEYQDFSLLFLTLIQSLRTSCPSARLLAVGDDWQAINRFAGSDVEYFINFNNYFPEDCKKLFIPTNYRSAKKIVKNANYFMSTSTKDYKGCKAGNKKLKGIINLIDMNVEPIIPIPNFEKFFPEDLPLNYKRYISKVYHLIVANKDKTIKILHRNNNLSFKGILLDDFCQKLCSLLAENQQITPETNISCSTIHRSKGLEADVVILLEIDAGKFPSKDKSGGLYDIFGETEKTLFEDEARLFYVALTRPKEKLYILSKTVKSSKETRKYNFLSYLNDAWLSFE
ncbi:UvrD-helicase domain-containing protein [Candidatus Saccharibacteria bacterium]|nr:UvrD-helicase domain-containing protein [Candidatus Saccharibacteria bacterium]